MPGTRIKDEDRINIDPGYICPQCGLLVNEPVQSTHCGHLFCQSCIDIPLKSSNSICPEDGEELIAEKIFPDKFRRGELDKIHLHCGNPGCSWYSTYKDLQNHMKDCQHSLKKNSNEEGLSQEAHCANPGCSWQSTYEKLEGHSQICEHAVIKCVHSQCQKKLKRSQLGRHLKNECQYRNVRCEHCGKDVQIALMKEHVDSFCENAPVTCKYCKETVMKRDLERHDCINHSSIGEVRDVQPIENQIRFGRPHFNNGLITLVSSLLRLVFTILPLGIPPPDVASVLQNIRDNITDICFDFPGKIVMLVGKLTGLERRIETLESSDGDAEREIKELRIKRESLSSEIDHQRERNMSLERELRDKMSIIERLQSRMDQTDESLALNTVKITDLESQRDPRFKQSIIHSYNGTLLWKIESYQRKRQDAISGVKTALYSPPFYSAQFGYKMCAKIYMNGDGFGKGSHLSLFFVVMRGDYDALQTWPFQKKITMMLLDQGKGDHMIDAFHSDPESSSFQRPKSDMNIASGSPLFMPLDRLNNRQYIKDDVMFIKVIVD